jgi:hypothetical protein
MIKPSTPNLPDRASAVATTILLTLRVARPGTLVEAIAAIIAEESEAIRREILDDHSKGLEP